jgi:hypothetical protein
LRTLESTPAPRNMPEVAQKERLFGARTSQ